MAGKGGGMSAEPETGVAQPAVAPDLRRLATRLTQWHAALRPILRTAVNLTVFLLAAAFYVLLLASPENFEIVLLFAAGASPITLIGLFITRIASKRLINELPAALLFSAIVPFTFTSIFHILIMVEEAGGIARAAQIALIAAALLGACFCLYRLCSGNKDDGAALLDALPVAAGIATVMLVFRLMAPDDGRWDDAVIFMAALTCLIAVIGYSWRRGDVAAFLIWPLSAFLVASYAFNADVDPQLSNPGITRYVTPYALLAILPALVWWLFQLFINRKTGRLDKSDRLGISIKALYRHWERSELVGQGAVEQLTSRSSQLFNDVAYLILSVAVLYGILSAAFGNEAELLRSVSLWIFIPFLTVFIAIGYQSAFSLLMRLFVKRRLRFSAMALAAILSLIPTILIAYRIWKVGKLPQGDDVEVWLSIQVILWLVTLHLIMRLVRNVDYTAERVRFGAMTIMGFFISYPVFHYFLGPEAYARFDVGMPVGDAGWLMTFLLLIPVYAYHFRERSAFLVWLFGSAAGGLLLRAMVSVEARLDDISELVVVNADMSEVVLAAFFGAATGSLGLLAKHIWYDKDPTKRERAVRVRGLFTIIHAVSPLVALLLFLMVASAFRDNANVIITDAAGNFTQLTSSVVKIKDRAEKGARKLKRQADKLVREITETIPEEAIQLSANLQLQANQLVEQTTEAAKQTATVALDKAKATASELGDKLSEALTPEIDFGFLGKLKMPDLGIGKFFKNLVSGLIPDLNLETLFQEAMASLYADVEKQFEQPLATATAMKDSVTNFVGRHQRKLEKIKDKALKEATDMVADIQLEKENTIKHINALAINAVTFFYQMLLFLILATGTIMGYLAWKVINGLVFMVARVRNGWTMLRYAVDIQYEKQIL